MSLPIDFDWKTYLLLNPDVAKSFPTESLAIKHWLRHGHKENRSYSLSPSSELSTSTFLDFYYLVDLSYKDNHCRGLFNQLNSLAKSIIIGSIMKRNIVISKFYVDYKKNTGIPLSNIINLNKFEQLLHSKLNINIKLFDDKSLPNISWTSISDCQLSFTKKYVDFYTIKSIFDVSTNPYLY